MRVPLSWLRDFAPIPGTPAEVAEALDDLGLVVDALEQPGAEVQGVITAKVLAVSDHPNADRLTLVDIDQGDATTRVVCGARNLQSGDVVPYAPVGATLPGGITLERRKIRGEVSEGMLCSAAELNLGDDHSGILHLSPDTELGIDAASTLGLDDAVYDVDVTPNRADAMSVVGIARDLAARAGVAFTLPDADLETAGDPTATSASIVVEEQGRCTRFTARVLDVTPGPSPEWIARRLRLAGMRPISNIVDVTNYVMLERGQPLHAFDLDLLPGAGIVVRLAEPGERLTTLDAVARELTGDDLLICDAERSPQAIAGIMGGDGTEVSEGTQRILLEAAHFEPGGIARSSKRLGLRSEASARFERGVDPGGVLAGSARAAELLSKVAGARCAPDPLDEYPEPAQRPRIRLRPQRVAALLRIEQSDEELAVLLEPLGIEVADDGVADDGVADDEAADDEVADDEGARDEDTAPGRDDLGESGIDMLPPTFRPDLRREIDLIEEVARRVGYNTIERTTPTSPEIRGGLTTLQRDRRVAVDALVGIGLDEVVTLSFLAPGDLESAQLPPTGVEVENPLRADESILRPRLLPGLLGVAALNAARQLPDVALFEAGHVFAPPRSKEILPDERDALAALIVGRHRSGPHSVQREVDAYDAVDAWEAVAESLGLAEHRLEPTDAPGLRPGRAVAIIVDGETVGSLGEIAAAVLNAFGVPVPAVAFEVDLDAVLDAARRPRRLRQPSRFPMSSIDLAFIVDAHVPAGALARTLEATGDDLVESVRCFDEYTGDAGGWGKEWGKDDGASPSPWRCARRSAPSPMPRWGRYGPASSGPWKTPTGPRSGAEAIPFRSYA